MPAYAYPITINRKRLSIKFDEVKNVESDFLFLNDLEFIGNDAFSIREQEDSSGYVVSVIRSRLETVEEMNARVTSEEAYMKEYRRRNSKGNQ